MSSQFSDSDEDVSLAVLTKTKILKNPSKKPSKKPRKKRQNKLKWDCEICNDKFTSKKAMVAHSKDVHKIKKEHEENGKRIQYEFDHSLEAYVCTNCSAEFQAKEEVEAHVQQNHVEEYACEDCDEKFESAYHFACHRKRHSADNLYSCPLCVYKTPHRGCISTHIKRIHFNSFYFYCETCGKGFNDASYFKEHENEHLGIKPFVCIVCNKSYTYSRYLTLHQVNYHTVGIEGKLFATQCRFCMRIFGKVATLDKHIQTNHMRSEPPIKRHLCDICGKDFAKKDKLNIHYRVHTGQKPYICKFCDKGFIKKDYLIMHERVHTGEKPYSCEYCGKCFNQLTPLKTHIRGHTGECPYVCPFCNVGFTSKGSLTMHQKSCVGYFQ